MMDKIKELLNKQAEKKIEEGDLVKEVGGTKEIFEEMRLASIETKPSLILEWMRQIDVEFQERVMIKFELIW